MTKKVSGTDPGQRRLNGPQTTGRDYRNLSQPEYEMARDDDVAVPMRDGVALLADVHRPTKPGHYPVLIAAAARWVAEIILPWIGAPGVSCA